MSKKQFEWNSINHGDNTDCWYGYYGNEELGYIEYWEKWKKWVWNQGEDIIMSKNCLQEVVKKIDALQENSEVNK